MCGSCSYGEGIGLFQMFYIYSSWLSVCTVVQLRERSDSAPMQLVPDSAAVFPPLMRFFVEDGGGETPTCPAWHFFALMSRPPPPPAKLWLVPCCACWVFNVDLQWPRESDWPPS